MDNQHPFSLIKTELIWEGKYDEYGNRLIWGDNKLFMASLLRDFKVKIDQNGQGPVISLQREDQWKRVNDTCWAGYNCFLVR